MKLIVAVALALFAAAPAFAQQASCPAYGEHAKTHPTTELTYVLSPTDQCKLLVFKNTTAENVTLPNTGAQFPMGWTVHIWAQGSGGLTLSTTPDSASPTINGSSSLAVANPKSVDIYIDNNLNYWARTVTGF